MNMNTQKFDKDFKYANRAGFKVHNFLYSNYASYAKKFKDLDDDVQKDQITRFERYFVRYDAAIVTDALDKLALESKYEVSTYQIKKTIDDLIAARRSCNFNKKIDYDKLLEEDKKYRRLHDDFCNSLKDVAHRKITWEEHKKVRSAFDEYQIKIERERYF